MKKFLLLIITNITLLLSCSGNRKDEIVGNWIEVKNGNPTIKQGITIEKDGKAQSINNNTIKYEKWKRKDDSIILSGVNLKSGMPVSFTDTLDIINLTFDSLTLEGKGEYHIKYYRVAEIKDNMQTPGK